MPDMICGRSVPGGPCTACPVRPDEDCPLTESTQDLLNRQDAAVTSAAVVAVCSVDAPDCESCQ